jgi:hypothetical protein
MAAAARGTNGAIHIRNQSGQIMIVCASQIALRFAGHVVEREETDKRAVGADRQQATHSVLAHQAGGMFRVVICVAEKLFFEPSQCPPSTRPKADLVYRLP